MQFLMSALVLAAIRTPMNAAVLARDEMPSRFMAAVAQSRLAGAATIALAAVVAPWIETDEPATTLVWITYDLSVITSPADHITVMDAGRIMEKGSVDQVLDHPLHPNTRDLVGSVPSRSKRGEQLRGISGMTPGALNRPASCACHLNDR